jgi:general secretion pathway protein E/type IV pilus assembly protein PilB
MDNVLDLLVSEGLVDESRAHDVRALAGAGQPLADALRDAGGASEEKLLRYLADYYGLTYVDLEQWTPPAGLLARFPAGLLLRHRLLPLREDADGFAEVATCDPFDGSALDRLRVATGLELRPALAPAADIERVCKKVLGVGADTLQSLGLDAGDADNVKVVDDDDGGIDLTVDAGDASIIRFVNQILVEALELRASDVHVEPFENQLRVRYRVDGVLQEANIPPQVRRFHAAIVSRLKILSHLDIAEKRVPQDGRIRLKVAAREIDLRVSVIPMIHGEAVVLRILDRGDALLGLEHLGMAARDRDLWERVLDLPHGIVLVTGPTGSGKTTTLYAALSRINSVVRKIVTVEDPVEYQLRGVNQIQVNAKTGLTFAAGLRAILRHDPDVILVGEIRDGETAGIAVQASLTGHLVFSTLHTNDAPGAATRLIDMGVEPYLVASSVELVVAQRLVRLICKECKSPAPAADVETLRNALDGNGAVARAGGWDGQLYRGRGCRHCLGTGYRGRQGVFELMPITDEIRQLILDRCSAGQIRSVAADQGMENLRADGWRLVLEGRTTVEEVVRVTKDDAGLMGARIAAGAAAARVAEAGAPTPDEVASPV